MSICLAMLVRNEASIIERCIDSCASVSDSIVIVDTGSIDDTIQVARAAGATVLERPWIDFGHNRTELLELARAHADYVLELHADHEIVSVVADPPVAFVYNLIVDDGSGIFYHDPRLVSARIDWRFVGKTHEYLTSDQIPYPAQAAPVWGVVRHHCDGSRRPRKFDEDRALLEAAHREDPTDARTVFYLANTYRDLGLTEDALALYRERARMGGWLKEAEAAARQADLLEQGSRECVGVPSP